MRLTLVAAVLLLCAHTGFAATPASVAQPSDSTFHSQAKKGVHEKKKGTVGFISGLLLGPVGLGGVYLFTHNHVQRKAAKKGCAIFATVVVAAAFCWLLVLGAKNIGGSISGNSNHSGSSGGSGGSGRSGGSGGSGGGHGSNNNWLNNLNFPNTGSSCPPAKKKPVAPEEPPVVLPATIFLKY